MVTNGDDTYPGEYFVMYIKVKSPCSTPETNIISYVNSTSVKKKMLTISWSPRSGILQQLDCSWLSLSGGCSPALAGHEPISRLHCGRGHFQVHLSIFWQAVSSPHHPCCRLSVCLHGRVGNSTEREYMIERRNSTRDRSRSLLWPNLSSDIPSLLAYASDHTDIPGTGQKGTY